LFKTFAPAAFAIGLGLLIGAGSDAKAVMKWCYADCVNKCKTDGKSNPNCVPQFCTRYIGHCTIDGVLVPVTPAPKKASTVKKQ